MCYSIDDANGRNMVHEMQLPMFSLKKLDIHKSLEVDGMIHLWFSV